MADPKVSVAFEATFIVGNYVAKPDILERDATGWRVIEVKSNLVDTNQIKELIEDLSYTVMVLKRAGRSGLRNSRKHRRLLIIREDPH